MEYGVCRQADPDLMFAEGSGRPAAERHVIATLCRVCPVRVRCGEYALSHPEPQFGVWGGMGERELGRLRAAMGRSRGFAARAGDGTAA